LPDLNGYELAERVRDQLAPLPITFIALTGHGQPQDRARSRSAGFSAHLVKPIEMKPLIEALPPI
jgi:two-component system CheB/CheR fusion protein